MKNNQVSCAAHHSEQSLPIVSAWENLVTSHNFLLIYFFTANLHFHSTKLVQDRISKIRNFLPNVHNLMKFGGIAYPY